MALGSDIGALSMMFNPEKFEGNLGQALVESFKGTVASQGASATNLGQLGTLASPTGPDLTAGLIAAKGTFSL